MKNLKLHNLIYIMIGLCIGMMGHFSYVGITKSGTDFFTQKETLVMAAIMALVFVPLVVVAWKRTRKTK